MKKIIHGLSLTCIALLTACSGINSVAPFDQEQAKILLKQSAIPMPAQQGMVISPRPSPRIRDLINTELVGYNMEPTATANAIAKKTFNDAAHDCKELTPRIISATRDVVLYQYTALACKNDRAEFLIGKAINGDDGVYVVTFSGNHLDPADIKQGSAIIQSAKLVYSGRRN